MNIKEIFPSQWLNAEDLQERRVEVTIQATEFAEVYNQHNKEHETKLTMRFERATKCMVVNKTQAYAIAKVTNSLDTDGWPGKRIVLRAGRAANGKPTIVVEAPAVAAE